MRACSPQCPAQTILVTLAERSCYEYIQALRFARVGGTGRPGSCSNSLSARRWTRLSAMRTKRGGMGPAAPSQPSTRWKLTWGAFAADDALGITGTSTGEHSQRAARRAAMMKCSSMGGRKCEVILSYHNQCAVAAHPVDGNGQQVVGMTVFQAGPSIAVINSLALAKCAENNGGQTCGIVYSNCTEPQLLYD
jgi:hypothetical protein